MFAVQTLLWSLEFVIQVNFEHDIIAIWNLARSSIIRSSPQEMFCKKGVLKNLIKDTEIQRRSPISKKLQS